MKFIFVLFIFISSSFAFAQKAEDKVSYKISQVDLKRHLAAARTVGENEAGAVKEVLIRNKEGDECLLPIKKTKGKVIVVSTESCAFEKDLAVGQSLFAAGISDIDDVVQTDKKDKDEDEADDKPAKKNKSEPWYIKFNFGLGKVKYDSETQEVVDRMKNDSSITHTTVVLDFGIYANLNNGLIFGGAYTGVADRFSQDSTDASLQFNQHLIGPSLLYFFNKNVGQDLYWRADAGIAYYSAEAKISNYSVSDTSKVGFGLLTGPGYSLPISEGTRMLFEGNYSYRSAEESKVSTFALSVGFLW